MECLLALIGVFLVLWAETRAAMKREQLISKELEHETRHHYTDDLHHLHDNERCKALKEQQS